ncbi:predicted protein [Brucella neotomae 5K33]|uniref:Uncharacterized protein n=1 Tax=Brucella neotomae 5K33 TaxID=520456 RepID=A0A7U8PWU4_BRUNE|nr:predicted protein [Brucella neotomae 5K33]
MKFHAPVAAALAGAKADARLAHEKAAFAAFSGTFHAIQAETLPFSSCRSA